MLLPVVLYFPVWPVKYTLLFGFWNYMVLFKIFEYIMFYALGCEILGAEDYLQLCDGDPNYANIVSAVFFEKFEYEEMRSYLLERTATIHKCRSKLTNKFGLWWYQKMSDQEFLLK